MHPEQLIGRHALHRQAAGIILLCAMIVGSIARADEVADYLERHGMRRLLASHLEQQMESAKAEEQRDIVLRLAGLYADLLDATVDNDKRHDLEERSRRLLERVPTNAAEELRLALLRIAFRSAERIAENHRLRLATEQELDVARKSLAEILPELQLLRQRFKQDVEAIERRMPRDAVNGSRRSFENAERAGMLYAQSMFLSAWAMYYDSWLNQQSENARLAEPIFAVLLDSDNQYPEPTEVSIDSRSHEATARSILGMALCKSLTASSATALAWIRLLEHENAYEPLRSQVPAWIIAIHLEHREYEPVREFLMSASTSQSPVPLTWLRLVAAASLEHSQQSRAAEELARLVVLEIARRGELQQVLDLANRYGADSLGKSGFALQYVHGVIRYQEARTVHGSEKPTNDPQLISLYQEAAEQLAAALTEPDATPQDGVDQLSNAAFVLACRRLVAWCYYFQSRFWEAQSEFIKVSESAGSAEAAEALWMAIICLDQLVETGDTNARRALSELTDRFLAEFPSNENAPTLRLRKAMASNEVSESVVDDLLAIPPNAGAYESAQRRAADLLYQLFRNAGGDDRHFLASRFLSLAIGLLSEESLQFDLATENGGERYLVRCRQVLEVSLADGIARVEAAQAAFDAIVQANENDQVDTSQIADEIECRRMQALLLQGTTREAAVIADQLWQAEQNSVWARMGSRSMFRHAHELWKSSEDAEQRQLGLEYVVRYGGRVLYEFRDVDAALQASAIGYQAAVAEASMAMWEQTGAREKGKAALFLYEKLLAARPRQASFLRATAILSEAVGEKERALDCWRRLASGTGSALPEWFEAKYRLIRLLREVDPARAREVMDQHKTLNPEFGPQPWGEMLKALDQSMLEQAATGAAGE